MAIDIEKFQKALHGRVLSENGEEPNPEELFALPEDVWGMTFSTWVNGLEAFFREESHGGTCMENYSRSRFFDGLGAMYWGLTGDDPGAIVRLPVYPKHGTRLISDTDRRFPEDETPIADTLNTPSGLWVPLSGAATLDKIRARIERYVADYERELARATKKADRDYFQKHIDRRKRWLDG
jgi:hypothetical protein